MKNDFVDLEIKENASGYRINFRKRIGKEISPMAKRYRSDFFRKTALEAIMPQPQNL